MTSRDEVLAALRTFDDAFAAGDADALADVYTAEAQQLLLYVEPVVGRPAILAEWQRTFGQWDTSAWRVEHQLVDVHADAAYAFSTYTETLVHRAGTEPSRLVVGRLVRFLRREADGRWRVSLVMNSHSKRIEEVSASPGSRPAAG